MCQVLFCVQEKEQWTGAKQNQRPLSLGDCTPVLREPLAGEERTLRGAANWAPAGHQALLGLPAERITQAMKR